MRMREAERATSAQFAFDRHSAAQHFGQSLADRQPEARAAIFAGHRGIGLVERLEDPLDLCRSHADARIDDVDLKRSSRISPTPVAVRPAKEANDQPHAAYGGELDGVADQIDQHLPQAEWIAFDPFGNRPFEINGQREPFFVGPGRTNDMTSAMS